MAMLFGFGRDIAGTCFPAQGTAVLGRRPGFRTRPHLIMSHHSDGRNRPTNGMEAFVLFGGFIFLFSLFCQIPGKELDFLGSLFALLAGRGASSSHYRTVFVYLHISKYLGTEFAATSLGTKRRQLKPQHRLFLEMDLRPLVHRSRGLGTCDGPWSREPQAREGEPS